MTGFEKVLMQRDGLSREEAKKERHWAMEEIASMMEMGTYSYSEVEDLLLDEYGLEMDYIMDLI